MNLIDYILLSLIFILCVCAATYLVKRKKKGKSILSCCGDCSHCNGCKINK